MQKGIPKDKKKKLSPLAQRDEEEEILNYITIEPDIVPINHDTVFVPYYTKSKEGPLNN